MAQYHVGCSLITGTIYAGTVNKKGDLWLNKSDVTEEALASVRDHLEMKAREEKTTFYGYEWSKKDGTVIQLSVKIKPPKEDFNVSEKV